MSLAWPPARAHRRLARIDLGAQVSIVVHGIANCDTVKRARAWLAAQGVQVEFHDFKKSGLSTAQLDAWLASVGWERLLNRQGTTWRKLSDAQRAAVVDAASAKAVMLAHPSLVKRPVVRWADGHVSVGFDAADWAARLKA
jgi:arsenate reductase (glutaredoxin)